MKVEILDDGLMIVPETEFEEKFIGRMSKNNNLKAFVKTTLTPAEIVGIKIVSVEIQQK